MQIDTGNCIQGKGDPIAILKKYPGTLTDDSPQGIFRRPTKKPSSAKATVKWKEVFEVCETTGGTQYYILEEESGGYSPLESADLSLKGFKKVHG